MDTDTIFLVSINKKLTNSKILCKQDRLLASTEGKDGDNEAQSYNSRV